MRNINVMLIMAVISLLISCSSATDSKKTENTTEKILQNVVEEPKIETSEEGINSANKLTETKPALVEEFLGLFQLIDVEAKQKYEVRNSPSSSGADLLKPKFYNFLSSAIDTSFTIYPIERFHYDEKMDALILWHEKKEEGPIIELFFWDRNNRVFLNNPPIALHYIDQKEKKKTHFSSYIADLNNDGKFDIVSRKLTGEIADYVVESIAIDYQVYLISNDYKAIESEIPNIDFVAYWETEESVLKNLLYNKNGLEIYDRAALYNGETLYNETIDEIEVLINEDMLECPVNFEADYAPLSYVNNIYSYYYGTMISAACGPPSISQRVNTINLNTGQRASLLDLVKEEDLVRAFKADAWVKENVNQNKLDTCNSLNHINLILEPYSPERVGFGVVKYDGVSNKLHFRIITYPYYMKPEALQLGFVLPPKTSVKSQLQDIDDFYMTKFNNPVYH